MQDMHGSAGVPAFSYRIVNSYPHDRTAFTQGLVYDGGYLYEGTGLHGYSSLRKVELESGNILKMRKLDPRHFGEGITVLGNRIIQLTYRSRIGFVYEKSSFNLLRTFNYFGEGWGITHDGKCLIMSDGTSKLSFLDPETFGVVKTVVVHDYRGEITGLNELEFVEGEVFANIWEEDRIARIDPETGRITGWSELGELLAPADGGGFVDVLNGIAYDPLNHRLFVTGKLWPKIFEIELIRKK
jgi:glutamine cyclotransferase